MTSAIDMQRDKHVQSRDMAQLRCHVRQYIYIGPSLRYYTRSRGFEMNVSFNLSKIVGLFVFRAVKVNMSSMFQSPFSGCIASDILYLFSCNLLH